MADDQNPEEEPSIEEILDSIRQIISDDEEEEATADTPAESAPVVEENSIAEEEPASAPEAESTAESDSPEPDPFDDEPEDVVELTEKIDSPEPVAAPEPEVEPESAPEPKPESVENDDDIIRGLAEAAALEGFDELVKKTAVEHNGVTIEEIVRTELRPLLRDWLDNNLPSMIERLVKEELQRVSKRVLEDV